MAKKVSYLETSPEKFQQQDGSGSCNSDSPTPTGNRIAAILRTTTDSSSPTEPPSKQAWDDGLEDVARELYEQAPARGCHPAWEQLSEVTKGVWRDRVLGESPTKLYDQARQNGFNGEINPELVMFWVSRREVPQK